MRLDREQLLLALRRRPAVLPALELRQVPAVLRLHQLLLLRGGDRLHGRRPQADGQPRHGDALRWRCAETEVC